MTTRTKWIIGILVFFGLIAIGLPIYKYWDAFADNKPSTNPNDWGPFGDYFGGILNPIISFLTLIVTAIIALELKRIDNPEDKEALSASFQPQLEIESFEFFTYVSKVHTIRKPVEYSHTKKTFDFQSDLRTANRFGINLVNLGLGPAKEVELVFDIPTDDIITLIKEYNRLLPLTKRIGVDRQKSPDNGLINYGIPGAKHPDSVSVNPIHLKKSIPYILNVNIARDPFIVLLPEALLELYTMYQYSWGLANDQERSSFPEFPPVYIALKYKDIGTKTFDKKIAMYLQPIYESLHEFGNQVVVKTISTDMSDNSKKKKRKIQAKPTILQKIIRFFVHW